MSELPMPVPEPICLPDILYDVYRMHNDGIDTDTIQEWLNTVLTVDSLKYFGPIDGDLYNKIIEGAQQDISVIK